MCLCSPWKPCGSILRLSWARKLYGKKRIPYYGHLPLKSSNGTVPGRKVVLLKRAELDQSLKCGRHWRYRTRQISWQQCVSNSNYPSSPQALTLVLKLTLQDRQFGELFGHPPKMVRMRLMRVRLACLFVCLLAFYVCLFVWHKLT